VGPDTYAPTPTSALLASREGAGAFVNVYVIPHPAPWSKTRLTYFSEHSYSGISAANSKLVEYFRSRGYKSPTDKNDSIWQFGMGTRLHYFDWVFQSGNEEEAEAFRAHMHMKTLGQKWYETVPVEKILDTANVSADDVLLVDVGGNTGYDLLGFHKAHPNLPGKLIVQDLPGCLETVDAQSIAPVEPMAHDFFSPQPVEGAKAYYMKMVLHDWPDSACKEVLMNLKLAMKKDYSKILINEIVVPDQGAGWFETSVDLLMMVVHSARERRERDWKALIEGVGLKLVKIWECGDAVEKIVEVELA
jgi:hypothetical protein